MSIQRDTAGTIINDTAVEVGLTAVTDPFSSQDEAFIRLCKLLSTCGQELLVDMRWQAFTRTGTQTITAGDSGQYDWPNDFLAFVDDTGWQPSAMLPLGGPLSPQEWTYIVGRGLGEFTIYLTFRANQAKLWVLPQPIPANFTTQQLTYEYYSRNWVTDGVSEVSKDRVSQFSDIVLYEPLLIRKMLKLRFLSSKGFDTAEAQREYDKVFDGLSGKDKPQRVLDLVGRSCYPLLGWGNVPQTNYGR